MGWREERRWWQPGGTGNVAVCLIPLLLLLLLLLLAMFVLASLSSPRSTSSPPTARVVLLLLVEGGVPWAPLHPRNHISIFLVLGARRSSSTIALLIPSNVNCFLDLLQIKISYLVCLAHDLRQGVIGGREFGHQNEGLKVGRERDFTSSLGELPKVGSYFLERKGGVGVGWDGHVKRCF